MHIQLNGKPVCTIDETRLIDVYQLLGKHSFTFHLDKERGILDIMNPLQGCRIVLESKMAEIVDRLWHPIQSTLSQAGLRVTIVNSEDTRKQVLNESNNQRQGIWISAVPDDAMEVSVHYFFHHRKQSKQLSQLLVMNMLKYSELPIRGASLNWKDRSNYQLSLAGQSWTSAALTYGGFLRLSTEQLMQLGNGITRAAASFFSYLPILDVIEKLRAMEKRDGFEAKSVITEQPALIARLHQEDTVSLQVEETQEAQVQPSPSSQTEAIAYSHEQVKKPGRFDLEEKFAQEEELHSPHYKQRDKTIEEVESVIEPEHEEEWGHTDNEWRFDATEINDTEEIIIDESHAEDSPVNHNMLGDELAGNEDYEQAEKYGEVEEYTEYKKNLLTSDIATYSHKPLDDEHEDNKVAKATSVDSQLDGEQEADEMSNPLNESHNSPQNAANHSDNDEQAQQHDENKRQAPNFSTFTWLYANTVKRDGGASNKSAGEFASLLSYMNQKSFTSQPRKTKQPELLTMQRERAKREQSPSDQS